MLRLAHRRAALSKRSFHAASVCNDTPRTKPSYREQYRRSLESPEDFWAEAAAEIDWFKPWDRVLDDSMGLTHRWFSGGLMNTCYNALDRHVQNGRGDAVAIHYDSPLTNTQRSYTYQEMLDQASVFAGGLRKLGVEKGDRVVIYMPVMVESLVAMLACARLGAIHSVVFGGFASHELAARIDDAKPKVVVAASCGLEPKGVIKYGPLLHGALDKAEWKPSKCVIYQREMEQVELRPNEDMDWNDVVAMGEKVDAVPVLATDPLYILYTSGTTGKPKGVLRDNGGHAVALKWTMTNVLDTHAGETFWAASDIGWAVGHSYSLYGPLFQGSSSVLYEGKPVGTPDASAYWRLISDYNVKAMFTAPTALRAIRKDDPDADHLKEYKDKMTNFKAMFVAGERGDPRTLNFFMDRLQVPVLDHWWQTETGWPMTAQCLGLNQDDPPGSFPGIKMGSVSRPVPGYDVQVRTPDKCVDDDPHHSHRHETEAGEDQEIVVKLPLPPGTLTTLYKNEEDFYAKYLARHPGYYYTGDTGHIDEDRYLYIMARSDDMINVAGHRLATGSLEEVIQSIPEVIECAVFGAKDEMKGQVPVSLVVLKNGISRSHDEITDQIVADVRDNVGTFACLKSVGVVSELPKTRSGKVMRATIHAIADSKPYRIPPTIENRDALSIAREALQKLGYAEKDSLIKAD